MAPILHATEALHSSAKLKKVPCLQWFVFLHQNTHLQSISICIFLGCNNNSWGDHVYKEHWEDQSHNVLFNGSIKEWTSQNWSKSSAVIWGRSIFRFDKPFTQPDWPWIENYDGFICRDNYSAVIYSRGFTGLPGRQIDVIGTNTINT